MMRMIGSDFLFWLALHLGRDQVIKSVLATPPELLVNASKQEQARVGAMLDSILPVSRRVVLQAQSFWGSSLAGILGLGTMMR